MNRVLITGGAGFVGSHLAESYLQDGVNVDIVDDLSTGSLDNLSHLSTYQKQQLEVTVDSVLNRDALSRLVRRSDFIVHLAAAVGVRYIIDNPLSSILTNVYGTETLLNVCSQAGKGVLIASTSEVYGKQTNVPLEETDDCLYGPSTKPRWSYAASKVVNEFTALAYHNTKGLPVIIVRLFNAVGPRQTGRYGMVVPRFVQQALENRPITVYGDGTQTRTFVHVRDVVTAMRKLIDTPASVGQVVNVGGIEETSIIELARMIRERTRSGSDIKLIPYDVAFPRDFEDIERRVPCVDRLQRLVDYLPVLKLNDIVDDTISYHRSRQGTPKTA